MATYHVCDICGKELPEDGLNQAFIKIGCKKSMRSPEIGGSLKDKRFHTDIECHIDCAIDVARFIKDKQKANGCPFED